MSPAGNFSYGQGNVHRLTTDGVCSQHNIVVHRALSPRMHNPRSTWSVSGMDEAASRSRRCGLCMGPSHHLRTQCSEATYHVACIGHRLSYCDGWIGHDPAQCVTVGGITDLNICCFVLTPNGKHLPTDNWEMLRISRGSSSSKGPRWKYAWNRETSLTRTFRIYRSPSQLRDTWLHWSTVVAGGLPYYIPASASIVTRTTSVHVHMVAGRKALESGSKPLLRRAQHFADPRRTQLSDIL